MATPALAAHCPQDAAAIDNALEARADMPEDQKNQVQALRDEGMQLHEAGNHRESEAKLAEAMRILLNAE
ncbi:MAG TPA: hypothetical protein VHG92_01265 [Afifellaceae bacterium]|nr:hypothetical protein [Afifellaceae bacterium]